MDFHERPPLFIVEGTIQAMRISAGVENLIKDMQSGAFWTGIAAGLAAEPGVFATSASLVLYDGEEVEHMALLINGTLAIGTFHWLGDLVIGDEVTLVVSEIDAGPLFVHAILRKRDELLWTPLSVYHTRRGWMFHGVKLGLAGLAGVAIMLGSIFLFVEGTMPEPRWLLIGAISTPALISLVVFLSTVGVLDRGDYAEDIYRTLDVPRSDRFRIKPYSVFNLHFATTENPSKKTHIFHFAEALRAHKERFKLP